MPRTHLLLLGGFALGCAHAARAQAPAAAAPAPAEAAPPPAQPALPEPPPPPPSSPFAARGGPSVGALDRAIDETLSRRDFSWRMRTRRETEPAADDPLDRLFESIGRWLKRAWDGIIRALRKFIAWWDGLFRRDAPGEMPALPESGLRAPSRLVLYGLLLALGVALAWMFLRRRGEATDALGAGVPSAPPPDLEKEETTADQLPEAGWLALAADHAGRGDWRLALRALHLAALAELGARGFVTVTRAKTHLEYRRELARKAADRPRLRAAFDALVPQFEEVWYGAHPADEARYLRFAAGVDALRGGDA